MAYQLRYEDGQTTRDRMFHEADGFECAEHGPLVKIQNSDLEEPTVFAIREDRVVSITQK